MISGYFSLRYAMDMPMVRVYVDLPGISGGFVPVDFLVDSGSMDTLLHPEDAVAKVGIDPVVLADPGQWQTRPIHGLGGRANSYVWQAVYAFRHDNGSLQQLTRDILIAQPTAANSRLPSLLGMDILRHFQVHVDHAGRRVTLGP